MAFNPTYGDINKLREIISPLLGRDFHLEHIDGESLLFYNGECITEDKKGNPEEWMSTKRCTYHKLQDLIDDIIEDDDPRSCIRDWNPRKSPNFLAPRCTEEGYRERVSMKKLLGDVRKNGGMLS